MEAINARYVDKEGPSPATVVSTAMESLRNGLRILLRAHEYALDLGCDAWDYAVEIRTLRDAGFSCVDFRWLVTKGYVLVGQEVGLTGEEGRTFRACPALALTEHNCYILTDLGVKAARQIQLCDPSWSTQRAFAEEHFEDDLRPLASPRNSCRPAPALIPHWDSARHELWLGDQMVKCFKLPSPNQEAILTAFEEESWSVRIDDPLPPVPDLDPKRRLQDTIKSLNRCQRSPALRFSGDGTGEGILWEILPANHPRCLSTKPLPGSPCPRASRDRRP